LALIRVSGQPKVRMYLKGDRPVYVRNDDQTVPARATDLRALLDRVRNAEVDTSGVPKSQEIARDFYATEADNLADTLAERAIGRHASNTFFRVDAIPKRALKIGLDTVLEQRFVRAIHDAYPNIAKRYSEDGGSRIVERDDRAEDRGIASIT
jgi:hypothetical protein